MYQSMSFELGQQEHSQRLAQSHHARVVEAARESRTPTENVGRPPDPRRAPARRHTVLDSVGALLHRTAA